MTTTCCIPSCTHPAEYQYGDYWLCEECDDECDLCRCECCDIILTMNGEDFGLDIPLGTYVPCGECDDDCTGIKLLCSECEEEYKAEYFTLCDDCGQDVKIKHITELGESKYCDDCIGDHAEICEECGKLMEDGLVVELEGEKKLMCDECAEHAVECDGCGKQTYHVPNDWLEFADDGSRVCPQCIKEYEIEKCKHCDCPVSRKEGGFDWVDKPDANGYCPDCQ